MDPSIAPVLGSKPLPDANAFSDALFTFAKRYIAHHKLKADWPRVDASIRLAQRKIRLNWRSFLDG